jgi:hypothetical protein
MSANINATEFVRLARQRHEELKQTRNENQNAQQDYEQKRGMLQNARDKALRELVEMILPALRREHIAAVFPLTGFRGFEVKDPLALREERRRDLTARLAAIEADPRFINQDRLINPDSGELTLKCEEVLREKQQLDQNLDSFTRHEGFTELAASGYGTPAYAKRWWDLSYYADWKRGDELEELLSPPAVPGLEQKIIPFAEHAERYRRVKRAADNCNIAYQSAKDALEAVRGLGETHKSLAESLTTVAHDVLQEAQNDLSAHLAYLDREDLARRCAGNPLLLAVIKRLHGLEKKVEYLKELQGHYLEEERGLLNRQIEKLNKKIVKFTRPKNSYAQIPATDANAWLTDPRPKLNERRQRYRQAYNRVYNFQNYDSYQYGANLLWWDLILEGILNGDFVPEVRDHRSRFPQTQKRRDLYAQTQTPAEQRRDDTLEVS